MSPRLPFRYIEPTFFAGLLDDPVLLVQMRPLGKSLLVDCGQIHHLAKRVLKSVMAVFVTHGHMDHFMGIDTFIRHSHVSPKTVDLFGPPGIANKMTSKFQGYDWNLTEPNWCSFRVHEVFPDRVRTCLFHGAEGFPYCFEGEEARHDLVIYRNDCVQVEAELCDHKIPALIFRVTEQPSFLVDERKIAEAGLVTGDWLRMLKKHFYGAKPAEPLMVLRRRGERVEETPAEDVMALYETIRKEHPPAAIGYLTDIGFSEENIGKVLALMEGVTLLVCECSFLAENAEKARASHHLCTSDINWLVERLRPRFVLPMHLSKTYAGKSSLLYEQFSFPPGVTLLRLPEHVAPRPLLACEVPRL